MKTIREQCTGEVVVKKSRFIATLRPVKSREEAESFIAEMKKKYYDARHNCSAYILAPTENEGRIAHSSDDGEPSGTAGRPMLSVLEGRDLAGLAVVVTRYFGGVLLGTGGLVRAYQDAVLAGLEEAAIVEELTLLSLFVQVDYTLVGKIQSYLPTHPEVFQEGVEYGADAAFHLLIPPDEAETITAQITDLTNGKAKITRGESCQRTVPASPE